MFLKIFSYECKYWFKKPVFYGYFFAFVLLAFVAFIGTGGFFDGPEPSVIKDPQLLNSPYNINSLFHYFNKLFLFLLPTIIGATIYKDYKNNVHSILYSYPLQKSSYLFGKFVSSFLLVSMIICCVTLAFILGEFTPGVYKALLGDFRLEAYLQALFVYALPNALIIGSIVFAVVLSFRNIYAGFLVIILFFFLQNISQNIFTNNDFLIALFDPFAENTVLYLTQYWTLEDKNSLFIPVQGVVLYNRILWLGMASLIFGWAYKKFTFSEHSAWAFSWSKKKTRHRKEETSKKTTLQLPKVSYQFSSKQKLKNCNRLSNAYFLFIIKNWMFYGISFFGVIAVLFTVGRITNNGQTIVLPTTNVVLTVPAFFFTTIIMLLTFIYSGMLIHRERNSNMNQLVDSSPISNLELLLSKLFALIKMQVVMLFIMMLVGVSIQIYNNYYHFEINLYLFNLFVLQLLGLVIWSFASVFVHSFVKNSYLGIFILVMIWLGVMGIKEMEISTQLLLFNFSEPILYSDINGYRSMLSSFFLVKSYWFVIGILGLTIAYLFWLRGVPNSFQDRLSIAKGAFSKRVKLIIATCVFVSISLGFVIYDQEHKVQFSDEKEQKEALKQFQRDFKIYEVVTFQPKITDVSLQLDIYPNKRSFSLEGEYTLINKTDRKIDTLLVKCGFDEITELHLEHPAKLLKSSDYMQFYAFELQKSLLPGDSLQLSFHVKNKKNTIFERNSSVFTNGTFLNQDILPRIGYFLNKKILQPEDEKARKNPLGTFDSDFINFNVVMSTSEDQIAISQGSLIKTWKEKQRNYFQYASKDKIRFSFSFLSSKYAVTKEKHKGIDIAIYHHKTHTQNLNRMMEGLKSSLDYNTQFFGNYSHNEIKVIEFPMSEGVFATIKANTIPTSERRFISNSNFSEEHFFDPAFKVQAHELTHHWWGNKLIHGNALGAAILSESITDYITLKIYERKFGTEKAKKFKELQMKRYLRGRVDYVANEPTLLYAKPEDVYLAYGKGSLVLNTLSHYLGEEKMNGILNDFFIKYDAKKEQYPTSLDLFTELKKQVPDSLHYYLKDQFEDIVFYDTKMTSATAELMNKTYKVHVAFEISKHRKNDTKNLLSLNDYIELGFYDKNEKLIEVKSVKVNTLENSRSFLLTQKPFKVRIDPNYLLFDKNLENNELGF